MEGGDQVRFENNTENVVEFLNGQKTCSVTFNSRKYINKIKRLYQSNADDFLNYIENDDGSVFAKIPLSWLKISPPRKYTDEQREQLKIRLNKIKANKAEKNSDE